MFFLAKNTNAYAENIFSVPNVSTKTGSGLSEEDKKIIQGIGGEVKLKSSFIPSKIGTWTINNLQPNKPVYLQFILPIFTKWGSMVGYNIISGSNEKTTNAYLGSYHNPSGNDYSHSPHSAVIIPNSSTLIIDIFYIYNYQNGIILRSYQ